MPNVIVMIQWDVPDDKNWLDPDNIAIALHAHCPNTSFYVYPEAAIARTDYYRDEVKRLARFLREYYPADVEKNMVEPIKRSSAVDLVINLLGNPEKAK